LPVGVDEQLDPIATIQMVSCEFLFLNFGSLAPQFKIHH
jgi:hypothetical protein